MAPDGKKPMLNPKHILDQLMDHVWILGQISGALQRAQYVKSKVIFFYKTLFGHLKLVRPCQVAPQIKADKQSEKSGRGGHMPPPPQGVRGLTYQQNFIQV